jgi:hypothetical protein
MRYASSHSPEWGTFAQYCRAQAGFYRGFPRRLRRELEIAAHAAGVQQVPRNLLRGGDGKWLPVEGSIRDLLREAAK